MATLELPVRNDVDHFSYVVTLEGIAYGFEFQWNDRAGAWFISIADESGTPLLSGRRLVVGFPLLFRFKDPRLPPGRLIVIDREDRGVEPGRNSLGATSVVGYVEKTPASTEADP